MMKKNIFSLWLLFLFFYFGVFSWGIVLTFDNISSSQNTYGDIPTNYGGFNFTTDSGSHLDWIDTVGSSWSYGSVSGEYTALNNHGGNAIVRAYNGSTFSFSGVYARIWGSGSRSVSIVGYRSGSSVWSSNYTLNENWNYFAGNSSVTIDELRLNFSNHFLIDNLALSEVTASPAISANNVNFGNVRVGTSSSAALTVTNTGTSGSTLSGNINAASGNFSPTSGSQSFSLGSGSSFSRTFTYSPNARGTQSVDVSITSNAQNITRTLTGTGVSPVFSSSVAPGSTINFGEVEYIANQSLTLQNLTPDADLGNLTDMTLLSATISGPDASYFTLENFTPGMKLSKSQLQNLAIRFMHNYTGRDEYGYVRNATLTFTTDVGTALGSSGQTYSFNLQATTIPEPTTLALFGFALFALFFRKR